MTNIMPFPASEFAARYNHVKGLLADYHAKYDRWSQAHLRKVNAERIDRASEECVRAEIELRQLWEPMNAARTAYEKACEEFFLNKDERT